jgi:hypothetical protein
LGLQEVKFYEGEEQVKVGEFLRKVLLTTILLTSDQF